MHRLESGDVDGMMKAQNSGELELDSYWVEQFGGWEWTNALWGELSAGDFHEQVSVE